jgi:uncharacterized protein (UPF0332 family)
MAEWCDIARDNLKAAQDLSKDQFRSCMSRAYYAAFSAITFVLRDHRPFRFGRETPPHREATSLVQRHLATTFSPVKLRELKAMIRRLYDERLNSDYKSGVTIDKRSALRSLQDAYAVCRVLGVVNAPR